MDDSSGHAWLRIAIFIGLLYLAVALASGALAGAAGSDQMQLFWRLSAFVIIFSMSSYLRGSSQSALDLALPHTEERLGYLSRLFGGGA